MNPINTSQVDDSAILMELRRELRRLLRRYNESGPNEQQDEAKDEISKLLSLSDNFWFARIRMGILGGAFGYADKRREQFVLLENSMADTSGLPFVDIDYSIRQDDLSVACAIDLLFMGRRSIQALKGTRPSPTDETSQTPEFYPFIEGRPPQCSKLFGSDSIPGVLLCGTGETLFFIYIWKWLLLCQMVDPATPVRPEDPVWDLGETSDDWFNNSDSLPKDSFESGYASDLDNLIKLQIKSEFFRLASEGLQDLLSPLDIPDSPLRRIWVALGLLKKNYSHFARRELARYARNLADELTLNDASDHEDELEEKRIDVPKLRTHQSRLSSASDILLGFAKPGKSELSDSEINEFDLALREIGFCCLDSIRSESLDSSTAPNLAMKLHAVARFPVIPLYYATVWDQKPKQHLVISLLNSMSYPIPIWVSDDVEIQAERDYREKKETANSVVIGLVNLSAEWTIAEIGETAKHSGTLTEDYETLMLSHVEKVRAFLGILAAPVIDLGFIHGVFAAEQQEQGTMQAGSTFDHETKNLLGTMTARERGWLRPLDEYFTVDETLRQPTDTDEVGVLYGLDKNGAPYPWSSESHSESLAEREGYAFNIVPWSSLYRDAGSYLVTWAGSGHQDLPFWCKDRALRPDGGEIQTLPDLFATCREWAFRMAMGIGIAKTLGHPRTFIKTSRYVELIRFFMKNWTVTYGGDEAETASLKWEESHQDVNVALTRAFLNMCREDIQHAIPLSEIRFHVSRDKKNPNRLLLTKTSQSVPELDSEYKKAFYANLEQYQSKAEKKVHARLDGTPHEHWMDPLKTLTSVRNSMKASKGKGGQGRSTLHTEMKKVDPAAEVEIPDDPNSDGQFKIRLLFDLYSKIGSADD